MSLLFRDANLNALIQAEGGRIGTRSGVTVTPEYALRHSAVWGSLAAISEAFLTVPLQERITKGGVTTFVDAPGWLDEPAPNMPWETWIWQQVWTLASRGRCYAQITLLDAQGYPLELVPIPDDCVTWRYDYRDRRWRTYVENEHMERWPLGPLWHVPLYSLPGRPQGLSPIAFHAETIGVGLAAQEFGARFFGDGGHPTMVIKKKGKDPGDTGAQRLKDKIMAVLSGSREPIVLPGDVELQKWQITPDEAQFLNTINASGVDVARIFGVPASKLQLAIQGSSITYQNVGEANADWRISGLARYVAPFEAHLSRLLPAGRRRKLRFNFRGFLRADPKTRHEIYKIAMEIGQAAGVPLYHVNEMRAEEGLPPLDGGDTFARVQPPQPPQTREQEH